MADDRYHEFHLEGKQLAFLFMTATAVVVVSFLVGVMVGRGVQGASGGDSESAAVATIDDVAVDAAGTADGGDPAADVGTSSRRADEYTYFERLNSPAVAPETLRAPEAVREPEPVRPAPAVAAAPPVAEGRAGEPPPARIPSAERVAAVSAPAAAVATRPAQTSSMAEPPGDGFSVQVMSLSSREQAETAARGLASKGYPSFVQPTGSGQYRVRVGKYQDRKEAESVARRLETVEKFNKPWVGR